MYKEASRQKIRIQTAKGNLSVEQLWDLALPDLDAVAVSLEELCNKSKSKSFLDQRTVADKGLKLQFDIVLDVLQSKVEAADQVKKAAEIKQHNNKILTIIADKKEGGLQKKSISELEKMLIK